MPGATVVGDRGADRETGEKEAGEEEEVGGYESPQDVLAALLPAGPLTGGEPARGGGGEYPEEQEWGGRTREVWNRIIH